MVRFMCLNFSHCSAFPQILLKFVHSLSVISSKLRNVYSTSRKYFNFHHKNILFAFFFFLNSRKNLYATVFKSRSWLFCNFCECTYVLFSSTFSSLFSHWAANIKKKEIKNKKKLKSRVCFIYLFFSLFLFCFCFYSQKKIALIFLLRFLCFSVVLALLLLLHL